MSGSTETQWREALDARGPVWVKAKLQERPGRADDIVYDLVFEHPYPTRDFCQRWCAEQDNKIFHLSGHSKAVFLTAVLLLIFVVKAVVSWSDMAPPRVPRYAASRGGTAGGAAGGADITSPLDPVQASATVRTAPNSQALCAYITYQTDRCGGFSGGSTGTGSSGTGSSGTGTTGAGMTAGGGASSGSAFSAGSSFGDAASGGARTTR